MKYVDIPIDLPDLMADTLNRMAEEAGATVSDLLTVILQEWLQYRQQIGALKQWKDEITDLASDA